MAVFDGRLEGARGGGAFVGIPGDVLTVLGGGKRFRVRGSLNGVGFESSAMTMGGDRVCLGVHKATREAAGVRVGDTVHVELERDERERVVEVPPDLEAAFAGDPEARAAFERLSFTNRREYAEWVGGAKRAQTRERRLVKAVAMLRAGVRHPHG
jgi:Bacteriocin-protection, YdeI or OmpD-Associated/Domain of unknown function (DUF1905)